MCGIVGFLAKKTELRSVLGEFVVPMLTCMGDRGPDSAGLAVFGDPVEPALRRFNLHAPDRQFDWAIFEEQLGTRLSRPNELSALENHAVLISPVEPVRFKAWLAESYPALHLLSTGRAMDVYKDEGHPADIARRYHFTQFSGTQAVGHTRMATESAVSPAHAHPFTAGEDFCLVHNGSLSNPYSVRRKLEKRGIRFETDNDTEAACRFLEWRMSEGNTLAEALQQAFVELDGFYTLLMATADKMVLVRDVFACKPAIVAETDGYVAVASEYRALAHLPGVNGARVFEPAPALIYSWTKSSNST